MHINPDHFLQTEKGRIINAELNRLAWQKAHLVLSETLLVTPKPSRLYLLIGAQGAGKSTWAKSTLLVEPGAVIFDAILVQCCGRESLIQAAKKHGVDVVATWFTTSLEDCLARNQLRPNDEMVPENAIRNVFKALQPPRLSEGFTEILVVDAQASANAHVSKD
ncbi:AAA family ATPase [Pseudomonas sp. QD4]|uniref:AAA family ATPase n=1 Tax=Pseudomonas sp. QD4 TaxID=3368618 RepID=UPI003BA210DE